MGNSLRARLAWVTGIVGLLAMGVLLAACGGEGTVTPTVPPTAIPVTQPPTITTAPATSTVSAFQPIPLPTVPPHEHSSSDGCPVGVMCMGHMFMKRFSSTSAELKFNGLTLYLVTHDHGDPLLEGTTLLQTSDKTLYFDPVYDFAYGPEFEGSAACPYAASGATEGTGYEDHLKRVIETLKELASIDPTISYPPSSSKITCIVVVSKKDDPSQVVIGVQALGTAEAEALPTIALPSPTPTVP